MFLGNVNHITASAGSRGHTHTHCSKVHAAPYGVNYRRMSDDGMENVRQVKRNKNWEVLEQRLYLCCMIFQPS